VNAELVGEAIGAESLGSMREVHVAAVDLQRFDELFRASRCCYDGGKPGTTCAGGTSERAALPAIRACFEEAARRAEKETLSYEHTYWS